MIIIILYERMYRVQISDGQYNLERVVLYTYMFL